MPHTDALLKMTLAMMGVEANLRNINLSGMEAIAELREVAINKAQPTLEKKLGFKYSQMLIDVDVRASIFKMVMKKINTGENSLGNYKETYQLLRETYPAHVVMEWFRNYEDHAPISELPALINRCRAGLETLRFTEEAIDLWITTKPLEHILAVAREDAITPTLQFIVNLYVMELAIDNFSEEAIESYFHSIMADKSIPGLQKWHTKELISGYYYTLLTDPDLLALPGLDEYPYSLPGFLIEEAGFKEDAVKNRLKLISQANAIPKAAPLIHYVAATGITSSTILPSMLRIAGTMSDDAYTTGLLLLLGAAAVGTSLYLARRNGFFSKTAKKDQQTTHTELATIAVHGNKNNSNTLVHRHDSTPDAYGREKKMF